MTRVDNALKSFIGIMRLSDIFQQTIKRDIAQFKLNTTEFAVLEVLYHKGDLPIQQIAEKILIASSSTTYVVDKLESKGLLIRKLCQNDKRVTYASISEEGRKLMNEIFPIHEQQIMQLFSDLDDQEINQLRLTLKKLKK